MIAERHPAREDADVDDARRRRNRRRQERQRTAARALELIADSGRRAARNRERVNQHERTLNRELAALDRDVEGYQNALRVRGITSTVTPEGRNTEPAAHAVDAFRTALAASAAPPPSS